MTAPTLTKEQGAELANLFLEHLTPTLQQRDAEVKKLGEELAETKSKLAEVNKAMNDIELGHKRPNAGGSRVDGEEAETKAAKGRAVEDYIRHGFLRMQKSHRDLLLMAQPDDVNALQAKSAEIRAEFKAFSIADDTLGGYFVLPEIVQDEIIKKQVLFSPVRDLAKVQQTAANQVEIAVRKTTLTAAWVAETSTRTETTGQAYGKAVIPTHEMYALVLFSRQQLEDSYLDLQAELQADIAEQFGVLEGAAFVSGTGIGRPRGFLSNVSTNVATAAGSGAVTYADVAKTFGKLKPAYRNSPNCKWALHQDVLSTLRQTVDSNGRPIIMDYNISGMAQGFAPTLLGKPYVEAVDMPNTLSSTNRYLAVGDFNRAYRFIDRVQMSVQRLEEYYAVNGQVGLLIHKRVGGDLVLEEALSVLKNS